MLTPYLLTCGVAFLSALIPLVNLEVYLGGLSVLGPHAGAGTVAAMSATAAAGQMAGKMLFFGAGRGRFRLPGRLQREVIAPAEEARHAAGLDLAPDGPAPATAGADPVATGADPAPAGAAPAATEPAPAGSAAGSPGPWRERMRSLLTEMQRRPRTALGVVGISALVGLPPFAVVSVLAGMVRLRPLAFLLVGFLGRWGRFALALGLFDTIRQALS